MNVDAVKGRKAPSRQRPPADLTFALVISRFNESVTGRLHLRALEVLEEEGIPRHHIDIFHVPGAFEIPLVATRLARQGRFNAIICLGAVIRGETPHFDYICQEVSRGLMQGSLDTGIPLIFGVLTTDSLDQALARAGGKEDKGAEAAYAALDMAVLLQQIQAGRGTLKRKGPKRTTRQ